MQRNKNTKKVEQIEKISKSSEQVTQNIADVINKFEVKSILKNFDIIKRSGILVSTTSMALLILPFWGVASVAALFKSGLNKLTEGEKDVFYDVKNNEKINWRFLLLSMAKRFKFLTNKSKDEILEIKESAKRITALIFDDSTIKKTGKSIEGVSMVHDHVINSYILGYKLLVCGYWDGVSFIPIDFSLHKEKRDKDVKRAEQHLKKTKEKINKIETEVKELKEKKKKKEVLLKEFQEICANKPCKTNKNNLKRKQRIAFRIDKQLKKTRTELKRIKEQAQELKSDFVILKENYKFYGLRKKDYKNQYKKTRAKNSSGYKRVKEADSGKLDNTIKMLKRAVRHGFTPDYVLTDTWFFCHKLLQTVIDIGRNVHLVSMAKIGNAKYTVLPSGKSYNPHQIIILYERKFGKNSRKYKSRYIQLQAEYQGVRVKIFLIKFGRHGKWRMLVTTNLQLSFSKIMDIYKIRWTIEVFFKECKQNLLLGKCQSNDFDAQIADTTLSMIRYILLSYYERIHYGTTIGGLFRNLSQAAVEDNLLADINEFFYELLQIFSELAGIDFIIFYEELLRNQQAEKIIKKIGLNTEKNIFLKVA